MVGQFMKISLTLHLHSLSFYRIVEGKNVYCSKTMKKVKMKMRIEQKRGGKVYLYSLNKSEKSLEINENAIISSADYHLNRLTHSLHNIGFVSMNHFDSE